MKHIRKFNESREEKEKIIDEILENFMHISDLLGEPQTYGKKWGNLYRWEITWQSGIDLSVKNDIELVTTKLKVIVAELDDVLSAEDRLPEYQFKISLTKLLVIELTPKDLGEDNGIYNFIKSEEWREINLNMVDIQKYFMRKGYNILKTWETSEDAVEMTETCAVYINLDKEISNEVRKEFETKINNGLAGDRNQAGDIEVYKQGLNVISIYPIHEKTYITL